MNQLSSKSNLHLSLLQRSRVAVLVDGDNVPHSALDLIISKAEGLGQAVIHRVYGDMSLHKDWATEADYFSVHCTSTAGRNRADMHLVIGAMDIAHRGLATHFLIMSDDRDFGPLVAYLREIGMHVEWAGKPKVAPKAAGPQPVLAKQAAIPGLDARLRKLLNATTTGLSLQAVGSQMKDLGTVKKQTGKTSWRAYLKSKPDLYVLQVDPAGMVVTLRKV